MATSPENTETTPETISLEHPVAIVFGNEKQGISEEVSRMADGFLSVPTYGFTESLNISVAVAVCIQNITARLFNSTINWQLGEEEQNELELEWLRNGVNNALMLEKHFMKEWEQGLFY